MTEKTAPAYEVTATKRRPKTFDDLVGQEFVVSTLKNSLQSGKIAHAYLFSGPRGCGKTSAARVLARSLNCEKGTGGEPCGVCGNCMSITAGSSLDVIEIDGASNTSVNDVRQIRDEVLFPPQAGPYKIYIIDEVHMLSNSAFNALLKTIEEPPPYVIFIFATTEIHKVPATIKSRCQQFNFRLIPIETIQEVLKKICGEMGIEAEDNALFWIARESTGSMRDAFTLFDQVASFSAGRIREDVIREKLGLAGLEKINALAESCAENDVKTALSLTDEILSSGVALEQLITDLASYCRSLLLLKNGITRESLLGYSPSQFSAKVLDAFDSIRLGQALEILLACYRDIRYSVSPRFEFETAITKLSWLNKWVSPAELKDSLEKAQYVLRSQPGLTGNVARTNSPQGGAPALAQKPVYADNKQSGYGETKSLADAYRKMKAERAGTPSNDGTPSSDGAPSDDGEDMDAPPWSGIINNKNQAEMPDGNQTQNQFSSDVSQRNLSSGNSSPGDLSQGDLSQGGLSPVDRVLKHIPGTVIN
jgi:DNA polymerase-3 subunit gamma/tau